MAGLENILNIISSQQKQTENAIISSAEKKAETIIADGNEKAVKEYDEYLRKAEIQLALDYNNALSSVDAQMKRKALAYKVKCIDEIIEKTVNKLNNLPDDEYFDILEKLILCRADSEKGVLYLNKKDYARITEKFRKTVQKLDIAISDEYADIENGFILSYGLISENCCFRAIIEAERESVRDIVARELFGQVKK
ncbi:MAG: V-type ATP synthase subunit E [Ruminococcus sp.]|nr:V-type ATP synthase subunit E [Ruminococcus sp.]MDE7097602.1 V-type ATP synthase subunit E [Ruminococcus sp.]